MLRRIRSLSIIAIVGLLAACAKSRVTNSGDPLPSSSQSIQLDGTINGGGGVGVRCGERLEMLDLYEARLAGRAITASPQSAEEAANLVSTLIGRHFWNIETVPPVEQIKSLKNGIVSPILEGRPFMNYETGKLENVNFVESLPLSNDFGHYRIRAGCVLVQIAYFSDTGTQLSIVKSAWDQLDWLSKGILTAHELMYMIERRSGIANLLANRGKQTSESVREFVGKLFSDRSLPTKSEGVPGKGQVYRCDSAGPDSEATYAYAFNNPTTGKLNVVFKQLAGFSSYYQLRANFKYGKVEMLEDLQAASTNENAKRSYSISAPLKAIGSDAPTHIAVRLLRKNTTKPSLEIFDTRRSKERKVNLPQVMTCTRY